MSVGYARLRAARERTIAEGTARIWRAVLDQSADPDAPPPFQSTGVVDFNTLGASLETRAGQATIASLLKLADRAGPSRPQNPTLDPGQARGWSQVSLFVGDVEYMRGGTKRHWVRARRSWWEHPLMQLDLLAAVSTDIRVGADAEVRGHKTTEYAGAVEREQLKRAAPDLERALLGRRSRRTIAVRVWLDGDGRAIRIWWARLPPTRDEAVSWAATEFWDFGIDVQLAEPTDEVTHQPASFRKIIHDLRVG
jgi:hypothetical protein